MSTHENEPREPLPSDVPFIYIDNAQDLSNVSYTTDHATAGVDLHLGDNIARPRSAQSYFHDSTVVYPIHDGAALRALLSQIDMSHFGFFKRLRKEKSTSATNHAEIMGLKIPIAKRSVKRYVGTSEDEMTDIGMTIKLNRSLKPISLASLSPGLGEFLRPASSSPRSPYKGRHGEHPRCASCQTDKTPYWRDSWNQGFILCNACGLRYSKFKRRCTECNYVPRKEDKGERKCPMCGSAWGI